MPFPWWPSDSLAPLAAVGGTVDLTASILDRWPARHTFGDRRLGGRDRLPRFGRFGTARSVSAQRRTGTITGSHLVCSGRALTRSSSLSSMTTAEWEHVRAARRHDQPDGCAGHGRDGSDVGCHESVAAPRSADDRREVVQPVGGDRLFDNGQQRTSRVRCCSASWSLPVSTRRPVPTSVASRRP